LKAKIRQKFISRQLMLAAGSLSEPRLQQIATQLQAFRPVLIRAFPNPLDQVARFLKAGNFRIRPKAVLVTGEPLLESQRGLFEEVFGCEIFDCYASRECGQHACECPERSGMHINAECLIMEFENDGKPCEAGQMGRILITDLDNYGMPFVRYDIQDMGIPLTDRCSCGRSLPLMSVAAGRISDFVVSPHDNSLISGSSLCHYLLATGPDVGQIQIIQDAPDHLLIKLRYSTPAGLTDNVLEHIRSTVGKIFFGKMTLDIAPCESIPHEPSGKYRFCINQLPQRQRSETAQWTSLPQNHG
jgi:phenylacetate-CoA ligase